MSLSLMPNLYRGHLSTGIPFKFTYVCMILVAFRGCMFLLLYMSKFCTIMVIILAILMVIPIRYVNSNLEKLPIYYNSYSALLSFRGLLPIGL